MPEFDNDEQVEKLESKIEDLESKIEDLEDDLQNVKDDLADAEKELESARDEITDAEKRAEEADNLVFSLKAHASRYRESFIFPDIDREAEIQAMLDLIESAG